MTVLQTILRSATVAASSVIIAVCLAQPASSQTSAGAASTGRMDGIKLNNNEPIQIESDKLEIRDADSQAEFTGNVKVVQGSTTLQAGHMVVYYLKKGDGGSITSGDANIDKIDVDGKVFLSSGTQQATADTGIFNITSQTFVLKGQKVVLSEGDNVFVGCQLTVFMETGQAKLDSCGGRVKIQLDPKSQKKN